MSPIDLANPIAYICQNFMGVGRVIFSRGEIHSSGSHMSPRFPARCSVQCAVRSSKYQVASTVRVLVRWGPLRSASRIVSPIEVITVVGGAHRAVWSVSWSVSGYDTFSSVSLILELPAPSWLPCASILLSSLFFSVLLCSSAFFSVPRRNKWENDSTPGVLEQSNPRGNQFSLALSLPRH